MTVLTESRHTGEWLISEGAGRISRRNAVIKAGSGTLRSGTVLAVFTATADAGKFTPLVVGGSNGTGTARAILYSQVDITDDADAVIVDYHAEANEAALTWPTGISTENKATAIGQLATHFIRVR